MIEDCSKCDGTGEFEVVSGSLSLWRACDCELGVRLCRQHEVDAEAVASEEFSAAFDAVFGVLP